MLMRMMRGLIAGLCFVGIVGGAIASEPQTKIYAQLGHGDSISCLAFSPDGRTIVSGSNDNSIILWDAVSGRELHTLRGHTSRVTTVAFSVDGHTIVSGGWDSTIKVWDAISGAELRTLKVGSYVHKLALYPDGHTLASVDKGIDKQIKLWDIYNGNSLETQTPIAGFTYNNNATSIAFSPDGRLIAIGSEKSTIRLLDIPSGQEIKTLTGHSGSIGTIAFSPDGQMIVSGSDDKTIKVWDVKSGRELRTLGGMFSGHKEEIYQVAFSPDGRIIASSSKDNSLKLWNAATGEEFRTINLEVGFADAIAFSPDGRNIITGGYNKTIVSWDIETGQKLTSILGYALPISAALSPDGHTVIASGANHIGLDPLKIFDVVNYRVPQEFADEKSAQGYSFNFSPDGTLLYFSSRSHTIRLDVASGKKLGSFDDVESPTVLSPNGQYFLSAYEKSVVLYDAASGSKLRTFGSIFGAHKTRVESIAFSSDGSKVVSASSGFGDIKLWDVASGQELITLNSNHVKAVAFSPDGRSFTSGGGLAYSDLKIWNVDNGAELRTLGRHGGSVNALTYSPDGRLIATASDDSNIKLWEAVSGKELHILSGHSGDINSISFSSDGKNLISGGADGTIRKWDVDTGKELVKFAFFSDGEWVVITPSGYFDASAHGDKHLNVRVGNNVYGIDQYREAFYRPELVKVALAGGSLKDLPHIASVKPSPQLQFVNTPLSTSDRETKVTLKLTDMGGGIGDVQLYLNGGSVKKGSTRALKLKTASADDCLVDAPSTQQGQRALKKVKEDEGKSVTYTCTVKLINGKNSLRAIAYNADNTMHSDAAEFEITSSFRVATKPTLHAIIVGINDYEFSNPDNQLTFAVADADLFAETLRNSAKGLFETVDIKKLTTRAATNSASLRKELLALRALNPEDVFVFYVASHGEILNGEFFLVTSNVGDKSVESNEQMRLDALSQSELKDLIGNIPATQKVIFLDTCFSGAMGDAIQAALLSKGVNEDTVSDSISRAAGSLVLSASSKSQKANEGHEGHGLFTYVLAEGLRGKADKGKTGFVETYDLAAYVGKEVPPLAEKVFHKRQYPTKTLAGDPFKLGKVVNSR